MIDIETPPKTDTVFSVDLPVIPEGKRYFSISEVSALCELKPHVLRYWEQAFKPLNPMKGVNKQRYYRKEDILLIREIKSLLYEQGYTIEGAKLQLLERKRQKVNERTFIKTIVSDLKDIVKLLEE